MDRAKALPKSVRWLLLLLLFWLPLSPMVVTVTGHSYFSAIREGLIILLALNALYFRYSKRIKLVNGDLERLIAWLSIFALLSTLFFTRDLGALLWSARYSLEPLVVFWALHSFYIKKKELVGILNKWLIYATVLVIVGVAMITVIPKTTLVKWGYSSDVAVGNGQWVAAAKLPAYQTVAGSIPRLQSTLTGPIQMAGFVLLLLFLLPNLSLEQKKAWYPVLLIIAAGGLILTFSRAAWLALIVILIWLALKKLREIGWKRWEISALIFVGVIFLLATVGTFLSQPNNERSRQFIAQVLTRDVSDREHVESLTQSLADWKKTGLFGIGFGRSGAGAIQNQSRNPSAPAPRFVDNSYLRWYEELGLLGVVTFTVLIGTLILELQRQKTRPSRWLARAGIALAISALFTDMWLEAVPVITFFALAGLIHVRPVNKETAPTVDVAGYPVTTKTFSAVVRQLTNWSRHAADRIIVTLNPEMVMAARNKPDIQLMLKGADLITADGAGILAAAHFSHLKLIKVRLLYLVLAPFAWLWTFWLMFFMPDHLRPKLRKITGTDLTNAVLEYANEYEQRLALLGSTSEVLARAKARIQELYPQVQLVFSETGPDVSTGGHVSAHEISHLSTQMRHLKPHYLLVAFGVPKQEQFLLNYRHELGVPVMIGVSGAFDSVLAQTVRRAPRWLRALNLEWLWRLVRQPRRFNRIITAVWRFPLYITRLYLVKPPKD